METTRYAIKTLCVVALSGLTAVVAAQEDQTETGLKRELTLEREYNPSVQDANKVNTLPAIKEPPLTKIPVDYAILSVPAEPEREIGLLPAAHILSDMKYNKRRGYLNGGLGNYLNINGEAGYHILSTEKDKLNVFFTHRSTNGKVKYSEGFMKNETVKAKINDNLGGLDFRHEFDKAALQVGAKYGYSAFNYYGLPSSSLYSIWPSPVADVETNQISRQLSLNAGVESKLNTPIGYLLGFDYTHFSYKYAWDNEMEGIAEHTASMKAALYKMAGADRQVGAAAKFDFFFYGLPPGSSAAFDNHVEGTLTPFYKTTGDFWDLTLGANLMFITPENENKLRLFASPNIAFNLKAGDQTLLYVKADGEIRPNSAFSLSRENRYIDPYYGVTPSRTWLDAVAGVKSGVLPGFWFHLFGEYKITSDDYFFIPYQTPEGFGNLSRVLPWDSRLLRGGVELKYAYRQFMEIGLKGVYNHWNEEKDDRYDRLITTADYQLVPKRKAYGRPTAELRANVLVRPLAKCSISLDYYLATGRQTLLYNYNKSMNNINELNLSGTYTFTDTFGAYIKLNNLLFQSYEHFYGYPLQGFNLMAGVNINF
jgi:hypothetical protein